MRINAKLEVKIMHRNLQLFTQTFNMQEMHVFHFYFKLLKYFDLKLHEQTLNCQY